MNYDRERKIKTDIIGLIQEWQDEEEIKFDAAQTCELANKIVNKLAIEFKE